MQQVKQFEVVVIGSGVAGLSALYHLRRLGVTRVALSSGAPETAATRHGAGLLWGGQVDNFTRLSHTQGGAFAAELWRLGDRAFDELTNFAEGHGVPMTRGRRQRLIVSAAEQVEAEKAVAELQAQGLGAKLVAPSDLLTPRVIAVQDDGPRGGAIDTYALMEALEKETADVPRFGPTRKLQLSSSGASLHLDDDVRVDCEMVVVCAHLGIGDLIPELKSALVPFADQWSEIRLRERAPSWKGTAFSANHTYEWGVFPSPDRVRFGGGRYLRPMAGIEATSATVDPKITAHLLGQLAKTFTFADGAEVVLTVASRDIRPCDELPLIGPMFGDGRALVATGFMGAGLTMGFLAGRCLAELVKSGRCDILPRKLWPERLRTLES